MSKSQDQDYIDALLRERVGRKGDRLKAINAELKSAGYEHADAEPVTERAVVKPKAEKPKAPEATAAQEAGIAASVKAEAADKAAEDAAQKADAPWQS